MIARRLPLSHLPVMAWLALAWGGAAMQAAEAASPAATPAKAEGTDVQLESDPPATPAVKPTKRATNEVEGLLNLGEKLSSRGDYQAAEIAYHQVLNTRGAPEADVKTALLNLAQMHRRQGAMTKAVG